MKQEERGKKDSSEDSCEGPPPTVGLCSRITKHLQVFFLKKTKFSESIKHRDHRCILSYMHLVNSVVSLTYFLRLISCMSYFI